jgi:hypothetical protein
MNSPDIDPDVMTIEMVAEVDLPELPDGWVWQQWTTGWPYGEQVPCWAARSATAECAVVAGFVRCKGWVNVLAGAAVHVANGIPFAGLSDPESTKTSNAKRIERHGAVIAALLDRVSTLEGGA